MTPAAKPCTKNAIILSGNSKKTDISMGKLSLSWIPLPHIAPITSKGIHGSQQPVENPAFIEVGHGSSGERLRHAVTTPLPSSYTREVHSKNMGRKHLGHNFTSLNPRAKTITHIYIYIYIHYGHVTRTHTNNNILHKLNNIKYIYIYYCNLKLYLIFYKIFNLIIFKNIFIN